MTSRPDPTLSDTDLTERGLPVLEMSGLATGAQGRVLVIACGALAREIIALRDMGGWDHLDITCLPAILHVYPDRITGAVEEAVRKHRANYADIFVAYADCGTGGQLFEKCKELGVQMIKGPHCYSFFDGNASFEAREEVTSFFLTDFLARQFDAFVWRPLGLEKHPELRDIYFGNYEKLVYLAQSKDPAIEAKAREAASRLGLEYEQRFTGYGDLESSLKDWVAQDLPRKT
ncbi:MAG: hypothetical protein ACJA06_002334 [Halocynthiibacter sp.]|jgi:hypothetical protein